MGVHRAEDTAPADSRPQEPRQLVEEEQKLPLRQVSSEAASGAATAVGASLSVSAVASAGDSGQPSRQMSPRQQDSEGPAARSKVAAVSGVYRADSFKDLALGRMMAPRLDLDHFNHLLTKKLEKLRAASADEDGREVEQLDGDGAQVDATDEDGMSALMRMSLKGNGHAVQQLLQKGACIDMQDGDGLTALMCASVGGHREVAEVLLGKGASIDMQAGNGVTALMCASAKGHREVETLLKSLLTERGSGRGQRNARVGRNDPCPCGSQKKYKKCCG